MKLVVVNSMPMSEKDKRLYIHKGTGRFFTDLSNAGVDVSIFQFRMEFTESDFVLDFDVSSTGISVISIKRRSSKLWAYIKALIIGLRTVKKTDFYYLFYPSNLFFEFIAICYLLQGKEIGLYVRGEQGIMSKLAIYLYKRSSIVNTISPKFTNLIKPYCKNANTIRPMMDFTENDIINDRKYESKEIYQFLFVGRIERAKGVFEIVDAIKNLILNEVKNFEMHLLGDGADTTEIRNLINENNLSKFLKVHGTISDHDQLIEFYKKSDLFILPTHHEGFPRVLYEAMIMGVPIITTFVGSIGHLLKDRYDSIRIEPNDSKGLSDIIKNFLKDYSKKSYIAVNASDTITKYLLNKPEKHSIQLAEFLREKNID